jgi:ABC-type transport system involved in cytochrome bd biosynthesis fused ATPase/permease subunit
LGEEKQRLALARGIPAAKDSEIILLDEPTRIVDPRTEARIYEKLFDVFGEKALVSRNYRDTRLLRPKVLPLLSSTS